MTVRVLTVVKDLSLGGTQRVAQNLTFGVRAHGASVALFAHEALGPRAPALAEAGVEIFGPLEASCEALDQAIAWRPDIVHFHRSGYPNARETELIRAFKSAGTKVVETNVFARYDDVIPEGLIDLHAQLSDWCLLKWRMWRGSRQGTAIVLPNAVDTERCQRSTPAARQRTRQELGIPDRRFLFGKIGQPIATKWNPAILRVFADEVARGADIGLLLVGAPHDYPALAAKLPQPARERILFLEPMLDDQRLWRLYSAMDAFLHLSQIGESFGMVLCEAMLCEVPVITLSTPLRDNSQLEVVGHGVGGLVASDQEGVRIAMETLHRDPALCLRLGEQGRRSVLERFDVKIVAQRAMAIYAALLAEDGRSLEERLRPLSGPVRQRSWMMEMLSHSCGRGAGMRERLLIPIIHNPAFYRAFRKIKSSRNASAGLRTSREGG